MADERWAPKEWLGTTTEAVRALPPPHRRVRCFGVLTGVRCAGLRDVSRHIPDAAVSWH